MISVLRLGGSRSPRPICRSLGAAVSSSRLPNHHDCSSSGILGAPLRSLSNSASGGSSSDNKDDTPGFRPRRRSNQKYRPLEVKPKKKKQKVWNPVDLGAVENPRDELEETYGPLAGDVIRTMRREKAIREEGLLVEDPFEQELRLANYLTAETGSVEDLVMERRALAMDIPDEKERLQFIKDLDAFVETQQRRAMDLEGADNDETAGDGTEQEDPLSLYEEDKDDERDPDVHLDRNQLAHGDWSEMLVTVDRNIKLWRGGRLESYRALVIGGNMNGCGGFGVGKSQDPIVAVDIAGRMCKRNIFFVDRYQGDGLTRDLVGKQNSCKVTLRATDNGLRGNELVREILKRFGITNAAAKSYGNRNPYNVVRATFKALMTHESIEEIALKRGKRLVSIDRAMRMQI